MSSELEDLRNVPQSAREDHEATQSSILYLLQEATKLATPAVEPFLDVEGLHDVPNEKIIHQSPASREQNGPGVGNGFTGAFSVLSSSPWEVMSLINLQCERLLNSGDTNGDEDGSNLGQNLDVESEERKEAPAQEEMAICSTVEMDSVRFSFPHTIDSEHFVNQAGSEDGAKMNADENELAELISKNAEDVLHSTVLIMEENLVETSLLPLDLSKKADDDQTSFHPSEQEAKMSNEPLQSAEISAVDFSSSLVETDLDSSMCFAFDDENADSESTPHPMKPSQSRTDMNNNNTNTEDEKLQDAEEARSRLGARRRTPRKQLHPGRSPDLRDPELQGVMFSMHTELDHGTDQCRLLITSNYSELCRRGRRGRGSRSRLLQGSQRTSSSEEESDSASMTKKICASCCTRKTPLWRDAEDGTPLCNACGIRYKKYRVRCLQCWNIPRKEASSNSKCLKCGDLLRLAAQNKRSAW